MLSLDLIVWEANECFHYYFCILMEVKISLKFLLLCTVSKFGSLKLLRFGSIVRKRAKILHCDIKIIVKFAFWGVVLHSLLKRVCNRTVFKLCSFSSEASSIYPKTFLFIRLHKMALQNALHKLAEHSLVLSCTL